jgi:hypothetical protein
LIGIENFERGGLRGIAFHLKKAIDAFQQPYVPHPDSGISLADLLPLRVGPALVQKRQDLRLVDVGELDRDGTDPAGEPSEHVDVHRGGRVPDRRFTLTTGIRLGPAAPEAQEHRVAYEQREHAYRVRVPCRVAYSLDIGLVPLIHYSLHCCCDSPINCQIRIVAYRIA